MVKGYPLSFLTPRHALLVLFGWEAVSGQKQPMLQSHVTDGVCVCARVCALVYTSKCVGMYIVLCVMCRERAWSWDPMTLLAPPPGEYKGRLACKDPELQH